MAVQTRRVSSLFFTSLPLCFVGFCLFIALVYRRLDLVGFSLLVLCVSGGLRLWAGFSPSGIEWQESVEKPRLFAGEKVGLRARVENRKFLPVWMEARVPLHGALGENAGWSAEESLFSFQGAYFEWELTARRRGVARIGPATISTGDVFGFFLKERRRGEAHQIIVYPRLVPLRPLSLPRRDFFGTPGGESPVNDPVYILGTTDYHHGRPARFIHWKASARHDRLQEKVFEPTQQEKILLLVDVDRFSCRPSAEAFERTLEVVASLAARLDRRGCAVGLLTNGMTEGASPYLPVSRRSSHLPAILETLARLDAQPREAVAAMMRRRLDIPWGTTCLYFAFEEDDGARTAREDLKRRKVPVLLFTFQALMALRADTVGGTEGSNGASRADVPPGEEDMAGGAERA